MNIYKDYVSKPYDDNTFSPETAYKRNNSLNKDKLNAEHDNQLALYSSLAKEIQLYKYAHEIQEDKQYGEKSGNLWITGLWPFYAFASVNYLVRRQNLYKSLTNPIGAGLIAGCFAVTTLVYQNYSVSEESSDLRDVLLTKAMNMHLLSNVWKNVALGKL